MNNHIIPECHTKQSEFANHSDRPFIGSEFHKRLVNLFEKWDMILKFSYLRELRRLHSEPSSPSSSTYAPKKPYAKKDWKNKGTVMTTILPDELPIATSPNLIGYDQSYDSWETYANLRDSDHLHSYLLEKNLTQLIPSKFR